MKHLELANGTKAGGDLRIVVYPWPVNRPGGLWNLSVVVG
jgi:hypothetical protein